MVLRRILNFTTGSRLHGYVSLRLRHRATETNTCMQDDQTAKVLSLDCFVQHSSTQVVRLQKVF